MIDDSSDEGRGNRLVFVVVASLLTVVAAPALVVWLYLFGTAAGAGAEALLTRDTDIAVRILFDKDDPHVAEFIAEVVEASHEAASRGRVVPGLGIMQDLGQKVGQKGLEQLFPVELSWIYRARDNRPASVIRFDSMPRLYVFIFERVFSAQLDDGDIAEHRGVKIFNPDGGKALAFYGSTLLSADRVDVVRSLIDQSMDLPVRDTLVATSMSAEPRPHVQIAAAASSMHQIVHWIRLPHDDEDEELKDHPIGEVHAVGNLVAGGIFEFVLRITCRDDASSEYVSHLLRERMLAKLPYRFESSVEMTDNRVTVRGRLHGLTDYVRETFSRPKATAD